MPNVRKPIRRRLLLAGLVVALAAGGGALWLSGRGQPKGDGPAFLIVSGDTAGWISPCGCASAQLGGLPRRGAYLDKMKPKAAIIYADVGGAPAGVSAYQRTKFEAILRGEMAMGLAAHNIGGPEAALGAVYLRDLAQRTGAPLLSANLRDSGGALVAQPVRIVAAGGRRVALVGVLSQKYRTSDLRIDDPQAAVLEAAASAKGRFDLLIVLAYLPEDELAQLAGGLPEADAVVGGPTGQSLAPRHVGPVLLTSATNKGKFLAQVELPPASQRGRLSASFAEMSEALAEQPAQMDNIRAYLKQLEACDYPAGETGLAASPASAYPPDYRLADPASCQQCHPDDHRIWNVEKHSITWDRLQARGSHVDPACQQCHTTGYGLPGGFVSRQGTPGMVSVSCQGCHGPSAGHAQKPEVHTTYAAKDQCLRCHDIENSPKYSFESYWPRIKHGTVKATTRRIPGKEWTEVWP